MNPAKDLLQRFLRRPYTLKDSPQPLLRRKLEFGTQPGTTNGRRRAVDPHVFLGRISINTCGSTAWHRYHSQGYVGGRDVEASVEYLGYECGLAINHQGEVSPCKGKIRGHFDMEL